MSKSLLLIMAGVCFALTGTTIAQDKTGKVGVVQVSKIIKSHWNYDTIKERVQNKQEEVEKAFGKIQGEGLDLLEKLKKLDDELRNPLLSADAKDAKLAEKRDLQQEVKKKSMELDRARMQLTKELREVEEDEMNTLLKSILDEVSAYGKKNGYSIIHDASSSPGRMSPVVYYDDTMDITEDVIKVINAGHEPADKKPAEIAPEKP